jgi:hypothetical protein
LRGHAVTTEWHHREHTQQQKHTNRSNAHSSFSYFFSAEGGVGR